MNQQDHGPYLGSFVKKSDAEKPGSICGEIRYRGPKHLITIGPPGACKSAGLVVPNVGHLPRSMFVIDPKCQIAAITARKRAKMGRVIVLNPFGLFADELPHLKSTGFNPLHQLEPKSDNFPSDVEALSAAIIKSSPDARNRFFTDTARNIWTAFTMWERMTQGKAAHLLGVRQTILEPTVFDKSGHPASGFLRTLFDMSMSNYYPVRDLAGRLFERLTDKGSHNTSVQDVLETLLSETNFLAVPPVARDLQGAGFDFCDMRREIITIYVVLPTAELATQSLWLRLVVHSALRSLLREPRLGEENLMPPVLFMLDEFANIGRLDSIETSLTISRDYGIQLWPFIQDVNQIKDMYTEKWQTFFTGSGAITYFAPRDNFTAEDLARRCGQKSERMVSQNTRESDSTAFGHRFESSYGWTEGGHPLFRPEELRKIPRNQMLCFVDECADPFFTSAPPYPWTRYGLGLDDNPYFRG